MRAGMTSTVQQTLTPEAAAILKLAVQEACKRGHAQTTPLHVAATLLVAPSSPLRRACLQTHQNPANLPQCRALELCFNIALERLQAAQSPLPGGQPSYSNALIAALKRAQAHQRRGCPEQQQQPLLAVKVELEQLVISILDDPSVSRVMREAGFNSTDVKAHLEEIMANAMASHHSGNYSVADSIHLPLSTSAIDPMGFRFGTPPTTILGGFPLPHHHRYASPAAAALSQERLDIQMQMRPLRPASTYTNPILLKPAGADPMLASLSDDVKRVIDILMRKRMRNPILVGDSIPRLETVVRDVVQRIERRDVPEQLHGIKFVPLKFPFMSLMNDTKEELSARFAEIKSSLRELVVSGGAVLCLGDLQWLLQLKTSAASRVSGFCPVQHVAYEIKELLAQYRDTGRIWVIGTATNHTYLSCQTQYSLDDHWELQAVLFAASRPSTLPSRYKLEVGINCTNSPQTLSLLPSPVTALNLSSVAEENGEHLTCCSECATKFEKEATLLREQEGQGQSDSPVSCSSSVETPGKVSSEQASQPALPLWLQKALPAANPPVTSNQAKDKSVPLAEKLQELKKRWNRTCRNLHVDRVPNLNMSLDLRQQTSPSSSQVSGGTSRCQEQAHSMLRDPSSRSNNIRPTNVGLYPALNGIINSRPINSCLSLPMLSNGNGDVHKQRIQEDSSGCSPSKRGLPWMLSQPAAPPLELPVTEACAPFDEKKGQIPKMFQKLDVDGLMRLCKGLQKKVGWQPGVISTIAETVMQCRSGLGKRRGQAFKGDTWLLFLGYDRPAKRQMAEALAELIFGEGKKPICLNFSGQQGLSSPATWSLGLSTVPSRGRMPLDQLAEAVRNNPSSVVLLEDLEQADSSFRSSLLRVVEKGRLIDTSGRDVSFNNVIVVITSSVGVDSDESKCIPGSKTEFTKPGCVSIGRLQNASEDANSEEHQQQSSCKRKGDWDADDIGSTNKKSFLDLDLNMSADENDAVTSCMPQKTRPTTECYIPQKFNKDDVHSCARKNLQMFYDHADAVVVFEPPL